jgi:predicted O-methyltransferase YrrM
MGLKNQIYQRLPDRLKPIAQVAHRQLLEEDHKASSSGFIDTFFDSEAEYRRLRSEVDDSNVWEVLKTARDQYSDLTTDGIFGSIAWESAPAWYALVRKIEPSVIVETGVCNGVSTLFILRALAENESGRLYSVDYPYRAEEPLDEFPDDALGQYCGAVIPSDKDPGWIIPEDLRERWELRLGKSQVQLPPLLEKLEEVDLFIHDSEHSHPCMMFEYEIAWHYLREDGVIISDDIGMNDAFEVFCDVRNTVWGTLEQGKGIGFMLKP